MDIFSMLIGLIIGVLVTGAVTFYVLWRVDADDPRNEKKWSDVDFDRIFHDAWNAGFAHGKHFPFTIDEED